MSRSRNQVDAYYNRDISIHKPGVIPKSSRIVSPITANRHKYELKQRIWPKETVESWFSKHSQDERRAVYSFLDTLYRADDANGQDPPRRQSPTRRMTPNTNQRLQRRASQDSRSSKRELGEVLESLESFRPPSTGKDKGVQATSTAFTAPLPDVNAAKTDHSTRPATTGTPHTDGAADESNDRASRRYLSQTWRVINPRDDVEKNVRPDTNSSSFFNYTKKTYPEYFFIHPDWY